MDGLSLIREAHAAGLSVAAAGDRLVIRGPRDAEPLARKLIAHKPEIIAALVKHGSAGNATRASDDPPFGTGAEIDELRYIYEERVGIRLFDAGYTRQEAERLAFCDTIERWCQRHPLPLPSGRCAGCSEPLIAGALNLPDGARVHWEHDREFKCLIAYGFKRKRHAIEMLATQGLLPPQGWRI